MDTVYLVGFLVLIALLLIRLGGSKFRRRLDDNDPSYDRRRSPWTDVH
ncbi:MAG: hypothetical protein HYR63_10000 [Proteobacteria bacterium]|nr:hypothetical protein [Pseudomonadota bacterium]MBI3499193.1 hypothetical protein [Pseudomonadota bacterium]